MTTAVTNVASLFEEMLGDINIPMNPLNIKL